MPTFADVSAKVERGASGAAGPETRRRTLARYAARLMGRAVDQIDRAAVLSVLGPLYRDRSATGKLFRGCVWSVLAAAQALAHVDVNAAGEVIDAAFTEDSEDPLAVSMAISVKAASFRTTKVSTADGGVLPDEGARNWSAS